MSITQKTIRPGPKKRDFHVSNFSGKLVWAVYENNVHNLQSVSKN